MDISLLILVSVLALLGLIAWQIFRGGDPRLAEAAQALRDSQAQLAGRLAQLAESQAAVQAQMAERLQAQEKGLAKALEDRLDHLSQRLSDGLSSHAAKTGESMTQLQERLAVIDAAQKNISDLSAQMVGLQSILDNKQARGAFGEVQLENLVASILPPSAYAFQATVGGSRRVDCLLLLPNPPGTIAIDAKFPLESYHALRNAKDDAQRIAAERAFAQAVRKHIGDIAEKYIVAGETAESALMFLPSEAIYAELHANFPNVVEEGFRRRVWIVSPTTLMATLNTVRAILKDVRIREQAHLIQKETRELLADVSRLDERTEALAKHFDQAAKDIGLIRTSSDKIAKRAEKIENIELGEAQETQAALPPKV